MVQITRYEFDNGELDDHDREALVELIREQSPNADTVRGVVNNKNEFVVRAEYTS